MGICTKTSGYPEYFSDFSPKTADIKVPVLVIGATRDYKIRVNHYKLMKFPALQVKFVEGGHAYTWSTIKGYLMLYLLF